MKLYGSLNNRFDENKYFNGTYGNLKVGTLATVYYYSDSHAYEVVEVKDQNHIKIRRLRAIRTDRNGMSDAQGYRYEQDENNPILELENTKYGWKEVNRYNLDLYDKVMKRDGFVLWGDEIVNKVKAGKQVKRSHKINISFGVADEYFDYSF